MDDVLDLGRVLAYESVLKAESIGENDGVAILLEGRGRRQMLAGVRGP